MSGNKPWHKQGRLSKVQVQKCASAGVYSDTEVHQSLRLQERPALFLSFFIRALRRPWKARSLSLLLLLTALPPKEGLKQCCKLARPSLVGPTRDDRSTGKATDEAPQQKHGTTYLAPTQCRRLTRYLPP